MSFLVSASLEEYHRTEKLESGPEAAQKLQVHEILTKYKWRTVDIQNDKRHMEEENEIPDVLLEYGTAAEIDNDDEIVSLKSLYKLPEFQKFMYDLSWKP